MRKFHLSFEITFASSLDTCNFSSVTIDEARTPLIISGRGEDSSSLYTQVDRFVRTLRKSVVVELEDKVSTDEQADGDYVVVFCIPTSTEDLERVQGRQSCLRD